MKGIQISYKEDGEGLVFEIPRPSVRHLDEFVTLSCAPDLLSLGLFPNAKEITESMAAYNAVRRLPDRPDLGDPLVKVLAVGDGHVPRTAAMFAFRSAWTCWSIDPLMREKWLAQDKISRLTAIRSRIEDLTFAGGTIVIAAVHSHADLEAACRSCVGWDRLIVVAIPCCVPQVLGSEPHHTYEDWGITSPERTVKVWDLRKG